MNERLREALRHPNLIIWSVSTEVFIATERSVEMQWFIERFNNLTNKKLFYRIPWINPTQGKPVIETYHFDVFGYYEHDLPRIAGIQLNDCYHPVLPGQFLSIPKDVLIAILRNIREGKCSAYPPPEDHIVFRKLTCLA